MSEIKKVKLPNDSTIYDIDATTVNGHTVDIDVPDILKDLPTGAISTVNDAAELPLNALKVSVEAWQEGSGDPSPSNIRPIHGWDSGEITVDGKNLWDYSQKDASKGFLDNTYLASNGNIESSGNWEISEYIEIPNKTNYLKINKISYGSDPSICFYDDFKNYISGESYSGNANRIYTIPDGASYFRFSLQKFNETITTIIPNTTDVTLNFPQTIYGGEWDVVGGVLKEGYGFVEYDGSADEDWTRIDNGKRLGVRTGLINAKIITDPVFVSTTISNIYETISNNDTWSGNVEGISLESKRIFVSDGSGNMSVEDFRTALASQPLQIKFPLATPTTIDLSPLSIRLLEGTNNIFADCGEVIEGEYFVDSDLTDGIASVAEKTNTDTNDKVTQTEVPNATSGTGYYSLTFAKDHNTNTNTDGLYKTGSVVVYKNAFNNIPGLAVNDTNNPNSLTKSSDITPGQITVAKVVSNTPKIITVTPDDIALTNNTWDGTNTSLKNTLMNIDAKNVIMTSSSTDERMHVLVNANNHTSGEAGAVKYSGFFYNPSRNAICNVQNLDDPDGNGSIAWGNISVATGEYAQAMGFNCRATNKCQHVFGDNNVPDPRGALSDDYGEYVEIVGNGHKSAGNSSNARTLDWNGNEWIAGTLTQGSSKKIKKNISPITDDEISKVLELNGVKFDYIKTGTDNQAERGFIAEEVAEVLPNLVTEEWADDDGNLLKPASLNYLAIIPYLVEICKKQQEEINELKQKIKE